MANKSRWFWRLAAGLCAALALFSGIMLMDESTQAAAEREANASLARRRAEAVRLAALPSPAPSSGTQDLEPPSQAQEPPVPLYAPSGLLLAYDTLAQENSDLAGWLIAEGLDADLPVMYTPQEPEAYLRRGFDGQPAVSGCLFLGLGWDPESNYAIIFGHDMRDGSMFGRLDKYRTLEYAQAHPSLRFDTLTQERTYTILAAFESRVYNEADSEDAFRYYRYTSLEDPETFREFLRQVRAVALYDTGVEVTEDSRILALSTCSSRQKDGRFVVVAVQSGGGAKKAPEA